MVRTFIRGLHAAVAIGLLAIGFGAEAQWKWRDPQGRIQYSDQPPPAGTPAQNIMQSPINAPPPRVVPSGAAASAASAPAKAASAVDPALEAKRKQAEQETNAKRAAQEAQQAQMKAQNCERAQTYLRTLESGQRIAKTNPKGEREILDDAARARELQQTKQIMATECR